MVDIEHFHRQSSNHRPRVQAKLAHTDGTLHVLFRVSDRYVKAACTRYGEKVCRDSCVEIFLQPKPDAGYFNIEVNCGGTMLIWYVIDHTPVAGGLKSKVELPLEQARKVGVYHSAPAHIPAEITDPIEWQLQLSIPVALLEFYVGLVGNLSGKTWRANLFKCADGTSHPHWAAWNPIGELLNFHDPAFFGAFQFQSLPIRTAEVG